ncbi:murein biosynthesis integral membrane protein MurJ [Natronoglycomyces albus]|uniref:Virulence factor MviN n=1 Tax=Natronoglycomyces albus TaxID=2811108 RepID=A0A895XGC7_9ACTN|nr:lipid II flippase MurJ [Natronoglycomyces albus]QSB03917.1 hypothetical protein JQS30_08770 [Natronoglycomyces albus]
MTTDSGREVGKNAALISVITVVSRMAGFGRTMVLVWAVGFAGLGTAYQSANQIPNIIYEIVAGGAMAALVVPLLTGPLTRGNRDEVNRISSALLTWALTALVPIGILLALMADPLMRVMMGSNDPDTVAAATRMLVIFAPQLPLYGVAIVLTGVLQAQRRFAWPALAPLLSSLTMIGVYIAYGLVSGRKDDPVDVTFGELFLISAGTTFGVLVLGGCLFFPVAKTGVKLRVTWKLDAAVASHLRSLAIAGTLILGSQQLCQALMMILANDAGSGPYAIFTASQMFFLLPWGVLAVPLATAAYPNLTEAYQLGHMQRYREQLATFGRIVLILSGLGVVALTAISDPIAVVLNVLQPTPGDASEISGTLFFLGFGLVGFSLFALYSRALYAVDQARAATIATCSGWAVGAAVALALSLALPIENRTIALAIGWSAGMVAMGVLLTVAIGRHTGAESLRGFGRALVSTVVATAVAIGVGRGVISWWGLADTLGSALVQGAVVGIVVALTYLVTASAAAGQNPVAVLGNIKRKSSSKTSADQTAEAHGEEGG